MGGRNRRRDGRGVERGDPGKGHPGSFLHPYQMPLFGCMGACVPSRLVETLRPFPGMNHLDVAGGTGDVAFRVLRAIRRAEAEARARSSAPPQSSPRAAGGPASPSASPAASASPSSSSAPPPGPPPRQPAGSVVVCDINPEMLQVGRKKAQEAQDLAGGKDPWASWAG
jgi:hypothetical protein